MKNKNDFNETVIGDIILCEPITRKGISSLENIGLTVNEISPSYFYRELCVESKYAEKKTYKDKDISQKFEPNLYYQYTIDNVQFTEIQERLRNSNSRFLSNAPNEYPLLILGVAGNGKSIEINRRIHSLSLSETEFEIGKAYFDLEDAFTKIVYGATYQCRNNAPLCLFAIKLFDGIMKYIRYCNFKCTTILDNFRNIVVKNNLANEDQVKLFAYLGEYINGNNEKETEIFNLLKDMMSLNDEKQNIETLLEILMLLMYCSNPDKKHYIVFDNIEQYIKLNNSKIQISDNDISQLYKSINTVVMNMTNALNRIEKNLAWKAFKIIIVLRRTTIGLLDSALLHSHLKTKENVSDITGHIQIPDIWEKKKKYIWEERIKDKYNYNNIVINILDNVMQDGPHVAGADYQSIIAPLMSYGIRRNARAQAHAVYETYKILTNGNSENIGVNEFNNLMSAISHNNSSVRYMFRRALIEFQFKWTISSGDQRRWKKLGIGYLSKAKNIPCDNKAITIQCVEYDKTIQVSLMRRILTCLSYFQDTDYHYGIKKTVVDMFSTISLYDLMKGVLLPPQASENSYISYDDFLQFAKVLIALSDMSNDDTRSAPYVILGVNDSNFHINASEQILADILCEIWNKGSKESMPGGKYSCSNFGARITDAGHSFLLDWQASFSFMASLHCFTIPSLFFLKDSSLIKYVIKTVYDESNTLCTMYENEAERFCGKNITLKRNTGTYLIKYNDSYVTFKHRVKELHMNHLYLYRDFLEKNYTYLNISKDEMEDLVAVNSGFISEYIDKYRLWETTGGAPECF